MRNAFIDELVRLAAQHERIALVVGDLGYSVVEAFADRFPQRFVNAGVAEQNMASLAAGMASEGYHVFVYSIANFPTFRCAEQIRNDIDYHRLPVTIVAVGGGLAYGALGYSHHAVQDYALMRSFPHMLIASPGDPMEVRGCLRYLVEHPQPSYLRLGKAGEPSFHPSVPRMSPGQWLEVHRPDQAGRCLLSTGATLELAMRWKDSARFAGFGVSSLPLWGMAHKGLQAGQLRSVEQLVTLEDHLSDAGFGSWLMESARDEPQLLSRIRCVSLGSEVCGTVGSQSALNAWGGLTPVPPSD
jgi:transketolase